MDFIRNVEPSKEKAEGEPIASHLSMLHLAGSSAAKAASGPMIQEVDENGNAVAERGVGEEPGAGTGAEEEEEEEEGPTMMDEMIAAATEARRAKAADQAKEEKRMKKSFGSGLKKGFLSSGGARPKAKKKAARAAAKRTAAAAGSGAAGSASAAPEIETIRPTNAPSAIDAEVREGMRRAAEATSKAQSQWCTPDLLKQVSDNPKLGAALGTPKFQALLAKMQANPQEAMREIQGSPETQELLNAFMGIMGGHFSKMGAEGAEKEAAAKREREAAEQVARGSLARDVMQREEERRRRGEGSVLDNMSRSEESEVDAVLRNPEVVELLQDAELQRVIAAASRDPQAFRRAMADPRIAPKIRKMAEHGLLQIQR